MNNSWPGRARNLLLLCCTALILGAILSACEYVERPDNVVERRFTWFSYLAGEDVKESCRTYGPPRYRFIYNAIFSEQVRTYEINGFPDGGGGMIDAEIFSSEVSPGFLVRFPFWPWSGKRAVGEINEVEMNLLRTSLEASGFSDSPPVGETLDSHSFYWLVSACEGNRFHFNVWVHPSPGFANIRFAEILQRLDGLQVALPEARDLPAEETEFRPRPAVAQDAGLGYFRFFAEVRRDGLRAAAQPK